MTARTFDALLPTEMARRAEDAGAAKAALDMLATLSLAVLAGAFIALGAVFATVATAGTSGVAWGPVRVLAGVVFSVGLILVIVGGAELFTGNNLLVMAWASGRVTTARLCGTGSSSSPAISSAPSASPLSYSSGGCTSPAAAHSA